MNEKPNRDMDVEKYEKGTDNFVLELGSLLNVVGKLIDGYLAEIAHGRKLTLSSFFDLSQMIPELARPIHDGLYKAIDIYLKVGLYYAVHADFLYLLNLLVKLLNHMCTNCIHSGCFLVINKLAFSHII